jgi:hypothetical protein
MLKNDKFAFEGNKSKVVRRTVLTYKSGPHFKKFGKQCSKEFRVPTRGATNDSFLDVYLHWQRLTCVSM